MLGLINDEPSVVPHGRRRLWACKCPLAASSWRRDALALALIQGSLWQRPERTHTHLQVFSWRQSGLPPPSFACSAMSSACLFGPALIAHTLSVVSGLLTMINSPCGSALSMRSPSIEPSCGAMSSPRGPSATSSPGAVLGPCPALLSSQGSDAAGFVVAAPSVAPVSSTLVVLSAGTANGTPLDLAPQRFRVQRPRPRHSQTAQEGSVATRSSGSKRRPFGAGHMLLASPGCR